MVIKRVGLALTHVACEMRCTHMDNFHSYIDRETERERERGRANVVVRHIHPH